MAITAAHPGWTSSPPDAAPAAGIRVNVRTVTAPTTGVQRYVAEVVRRLPGVATVAPSRPLHGLRGHLWEQLVLPGLVGGDLLWSPANLGPLSVARQVVTIHDCSALDHPEWYSRSFAQLYATVMPPLARRARLVIAVSEATRRRVVERCGVPERRVVVVHPGVDRRFRPESADPAVLAALRLPGHRYLLAVATVQPRKNLARLVAAWARALPRLAPDLHLVLAGAADRRLFAEARVPVAARIHLAGRIPEASIPALYASALGFALPSLDEGFGLPLVEAMASGCPVLTSDRSAPPEVVGDAGLLVDPTDVDAIADGLVRLAHDEPLRLRLAERGRRRAAAFTWERCAEGTLAALRQAA